jgi:pantetheine-phosphate adenylyltransferase
MVMRLAAIYPGSFDPLTNGHLDVIRRAARLADHLIVAVLKNTQKQPLFAAAERMDMIRETTAEIPGIEVATFDGLLADYARQRQARWIIRGLRAVSDYEIEFQMAAINRRLNTELDTLFLPAIEDSSFISSRMVKEIITLGGDPSPFVPPSVNRRLQDKKPHTR